jgi:hypothetical protein
MLAGAPLAAQAAPAAGTIIDLPAATPDGATVQKVHWGRRYYRYGYGPGIYFYSGPRYRYWRHRHHGYPRYHWYRHHHWGRHWW